MKKLLLALLSIIALQANAKVYPLMGVVVDANGKDVSPLSVVIKGSDGMYAAFLKKGGLYYTDALPEGNYSVTVNFVAATYTTKVMLKAPHAGNKPVFYNFKVVGAQLVAYQASEDPFATAALDGVKENSFNVDASPGLFYDAPQDFNLLPQDAVKNFRILPNNSDAALKSKKPEYIENSPVYWNFTKHPKR